MGTFDRAGTSPFGPDGATLDTDIRFRGGSRLKVYSGSPYINFRLKFSNSDGEGWWVGKDTLDQLIAELLYIRRDIQSFENGIALDIEVGRLPADAWELPEDEEDEEEVPL